MPNTKSAIRRVRRVKKQTSVNRIRKSKYKSALKQMETLLKKGDKKKSKEFFSEFQSILMQVAKSGVISRKTAARKVSRTSKKLI
tara:strand:- start:307 stop:561 length:255 start_codon:yes stop_codon:yes gene_type:complete